MPAFLKLDEARDLLTVSIGGMEKSEFQDMLARVKSIPGARWDPEPKLWVFQNDPEKALRLITALQPVADPQVESIVRAHAADIAGQLVTHIGDDAKLDYFVRRDDLFPFQRAGVDFIADTGRAILADQMGLGKTVECIASHVEYHCRRVEEGNPSHEWDTTLPPVLVICQKGMRKTWRNEFESWLEGSKVQIIDGRTPAKRIEQLEADANVFIINWESFWRRPVIDTLAAKNWSTLIADEAHKAKNYKAKQTKGLFKLHAPLQIAATGTPVMNAPNELWPLLHWHEPKTYSSYWRFHNSYVDDYVGGFNNRVIIGVKNPDDLRFILKGVLVRRRKVDVLKDLPAKMPTQIIPVDLSSAQQKLYEEVEEALFVDLAKFINDQINQGNVVATEMADELANMPLQALTALIPNAGARIAKLRQVTAGAKIEIANDLIRDEPDEPVVAFTWHVQAAVDLQALLQKGPQGMKVGLIAGEGGNVDDTMNKFQGGELDHLVCTIAKGGQGLTLTRSSNPLLVEEDWTPDITEQAIDRTHRIGQTETVTPRLLRCESTIDTGRVASRNTFKRAITAQIIGG